MLIAVLNGTLSEAEQDTYIRRITSRFPAGTVERITLDVQGDFVDVTYTLHRFRNLRKMGGYCIGEPESGGKYRPDSAFIICGRLDTGAAEHLDSAPGMAYSQVGFGGAPVRDGPG